MIIRRRHARKRVIKLLFFLFIVLAVLFAITHLLGSQNSTLDQKILSKTQPPRKSQDPSSYTSLEKAISNTLLGTKGTYGIVVKNLKTQESYVQKEHRVFEPGSLYKIWILSTAFEQITQGKLKEDDLLHEEIPILNDKFHIATEAAEIKGGDITMTASDAMNQMITISHNYATLLLAAKIRLSNVEAFLKSNGFEASKLGEPPTTTPSDIALFFEKLYNGELTNKADSEKMLTILKEQRLNNKIPKYLPDGVVIAHKTGELGAFTHDAGIVYTPRGDYIIVILSESDNPSGAEERIAEVSEAVYNYFLKKKD